MDETQRLKQLNQTLHQIDNDLRPLVVARIERLERRQTLRAAIKTAEEQAEFWSRHASMLACDLQRDLEDEQYEGRLL